MCVSALLAIFASVFGSSAATAVGGIITSAAAISTGQASATIGGGVAIAGACGVVSKMADNMEKNNAKAVSINEEINKENVIFNEKRTKKQKEWEDEKSKAKNIYNSAVKESLNILKDEVALNKVGKMKLKRFKKGLRK